MRYSLFFVYGITSLKAKWKSSDKFRKIPPDGGEIYFVPLWQISRHAPVYIHSGDDEHDGEVDTDGKVEVLVPEVVGHVADQVGQHGRQADRDDETLKKYHSVLDSLYLGVFNLI